MELSQLALKYKAKNATGKQIISSVENLHQTLEKVSQQENVLNEKLSDYVFFPLSHVFRNSGDLPIRAIEVTLHCLRLLISFGWRTCISSELGKQLLILLAFLASGSPAETKTSNVNEELGKAAFECMAELFKFTGNASLGSKGSIEADNIPVLGHAISTVLDGASNGPAVAIRVSALNALKSMINGILDEEALRNFFPGIVSALTKILRMSSVSANSSKVLQSSLQSLEMVLRKVLGDQNIRKYTERSQESEEASSKASMSGDSWERATSSQVKMALANIIPLRYHEKYEVQDSLFRLCLSVLQECRNSLSQSMTMIVETLIAISSQRHLADFSEKMKIVANLFLVDPNLLEILKNSLHDWIIALPRIMQSNDDSSKQKTIDRIATAFQIISNQNSVSDILNDTMAYNLRASVCTAIHTSSSQRAHPVTEGNLEVSKILQHLDPAEHAVSFHPILFSEASQKHTLSGLQKLARQLKYLPMSSKTQQRILETLRTTSGDEQIASLWLSLQLLRDTFETYDTDQYLNLETEPVDSNLLDNIYSFSLEILSIPSSEDGASWIAQALALEAVALQAQYQKQDFRPELVDALYPILERMGSSNAALQRHAMTCLNLVAQACAYPDPGALVVANADYLVNAVALKLNTFEISPQAPLVLVMMINLCGASLIPYLDDLVESIFAILASLHGYPRLVESLFTVLHAIVSESAKSSIPAIAPSSVPTARQPIYKPTSMAQLTARLRDLKDRPPHQSPSPSPPSPSPPSPSPPSPSPPSHPHQPPEPSSDAPPDPNPDDSEPPLPPSTTLILSISLQTQNHLNTANARLLQSLLYLLAQAFPLLAPHPNHLLPLLASHFPLLLPPLHHPSAWICIAACAALSAACESGGDFLATRFAEQWDPLLALCTKRKAEMETEQRMLGRGRKDVKARAWEAVTALVVKVVEHVGVSADMEDGVFDLLAGEVGRDHVRLCLQRLNPDMLWEVERTRANK